jgi:gluconolactonase
MSGFEVLASGYRLVEGPTEAPDGGLYFSDVLGGGVYHRAPDGTITTQVPKRRGVGGIAVHADGGLVCGGRDLIHVQDGKDRPIFPIAGLPGWNDLCTDSRGRVYAGSVRFQVFDPAAETVPGECWRIDAVGHGVELYGGVKHANGIGLSPDDRILVHSDSRAGIVRVHRLQEDGSVSPADPIAIDGVPDGLAFDEDGCFWVAIADQGRIDCFSLDGRRVRSLPVPARMVTSLCFAGPDRRELIVVTADHAERPELGGCILRTRSDVAGAPVYPARV